MCVCVCVCVCVFKKYSLIWCIRDENRYTDLRGGSPRSIVANLIDCNIRVSVFKLQSRYFAHFWIDNLGKGVNRRVPRSQIIRRLFFFEDGFGIKSLTKADIPLIKETKSNPSISGVLLSVIKTTCGKAKDIQKGSAKRVPIALTNKNFLVKKEEDSIQSPDFMTEIIPSPGLHQSRLYIGSIFKVPKIFIRRRFRAITFKM